MKTSVLDVQNMLSVLSVEETERRIGEVPGVQSVTVNHATGNATVRYDETRLEVSDIKSAVRQRAHQSVVPAPSHGRPRLVRAGIAYAAALALPFRLVLAVSLSGHL